MYQGAFPWQQAQFSGIAEAALFVRDTMGNDLLSEKKVQKLERDLARLREVTRLRQLREEIERIIAIANSEQKSRAQSKEPCSVSWVRPFWFGQYKTLR